MTSKGYVCQLKFYKKQEMIATFNLNYNCDSSMRIKQQQQCCCFHIIHPNCKGNCQNHVIFFIIAYKAKATSCQKKTEGKKKQPIESVRNNDSICNISQLIDVKAKQSPSGVRLQYSS